jgi:hypothetical protein
VFVQIDAERPILGQRRASFTRARLASPFDAAEDCTYPRQQPGQHPVEDDQVDTLLLRRYCAKAPGPSKA